MTPEQRTIKFRAWVTQYADDESAGYMLELPAQKLQFDVEDGFVLAFGGSGFWACECYESREPKFEVMQYTGLKDKNGVEIYEGDVLKITDADGEVYENRKVVFEEGAFTVDPFFEHSSGDYCLLLGGLADCPEDWYEVEVVGNIHEHKSLISNGK